MRTLILTMLMFFAGANVFSQTLDTQVKTSITINGLKHTDTLSVFPNFFPNPFKTSKYKPKSLDKDTLLPKKFHEGFLYKEDVKMIPQRPQKYIGNNGNGSDIYQDQLDNMYVLKPDKNFSSGMPNSMGTVLLTDSVSIPTDQQPRINRIPNNKTPKSRQ